MKKVPRPKNIIRVNAMAFAEMVSSMVFAPCTASYLAERSGLSAQTVRHYLKALHNARAIHISDWEEDPHGGRTIRAYMVGDLPDAKKPQPIDNKVACAKYRAKMKQLKLIQQTTGQNT